MATKNPNTFYINFSGEINPSSVNAIKAYTVSLLFNPEPKYADINHLYFLFSSSGGVVDAGIELHNFLRSLNIKITMHNTGTVDSIATVIFLAGEERYATEHSSFVLHGVTSQLNAGAYQLNSLKEIISRVERDEEKIISIYCKNSELTEEIAKQLFIQGQSKGLDFALKHGSISEIREYEID